jgi:predicted transcriptional regulator
MPSSLRRAKEGYLYSSVNRILEGGIMSDQAYPREFGRGAVLTLASNIVAAYLTRNETAPAALPPLISSVFNALSGLGDGAAAAPRTRSTPAVPIAKSVTPDYLVCLEDGRRLKMLKRHLRSVFNMTPEDYRAKWGLPRDYPMVASSYARRRSELAKTIGLGKTGRKPRRKARAASLERV